MAYSSNLEPTGLTAKTTPIDADVVIIGDSTDANEVAKKTTWANVKATLVTYFDTLYQTILVSGTNIKTINGTSLLGSGDIAVPVLTDGDKGDITVSASGATFTIDNGAVTLAKMANLAQDQFIGRTTASTGVPQTATITSAARTVLDDTSVANMVDTLGGATSTGSGGLVRATSPTLVTPALGTPSSGTLTNCTGLPLAGVVGVTATASELNVLDGITSTTAELNYTDGVTSNIQTQLDTLARNLPRVTSETSSATPTINSDNTDVHRITALAVAITSFTTNLSGTPTHGQNLVIEITGTASRAITWGASFEASTVALPTTTDGTNMLTVGFKWNSATSKFRCLAVA
jgi:hypothetical protein